MEQLLLKLRRARIVKSIRGRCGGYVLAKPASKITVKDIIESVEGSILETICFGAHPTGKTTKAKGCLVRSVLLGFKIKDLLNFPASPLEIVQRFQG